MPKSRDPLLWPFASTSIWNMPIGDGAVYVPANIQPATAAGMTVDEDILILTPDAPLVPVYLNTADWTGRSRCEPEDTLLFEVPIPEAFELPHYPPNTPNNSAAILMPDGRTLVQTQPFHRCEAGEPATSHYVFPEVDLYGDGIPGAHGGSALSSIGGTLRLGELVPGSVIHHALKVNLYGARNYFYAENEADGKAGYRWPATAADGYANDPDNRNRYQGENPALQMGSLLAIHPDVDLEANELELETEAAKILAQALQDYGAYVVDDTAWDVYAIATEHSPEGRVMDEFREVWGFPINAPTVNFTAWGRDMKKIFINLYVVDNNGPGSIGGGGKPRVPLAPEIMPEDL